MQIYPLHLKKFFSIYSTLILDLNKNIYKILKKKMAKVIYKKSDVDKWVDYQVMRKFLCNQKGKLQSLIPKWTKWTKSLPVSQSKIVPKKYVSQAKWQKKGMEKRRIYLHYSWVAFLHRYTIRYRNHDKLMQKRGIKRFFLLFYYYYFWC